MAGAPHFGKRLALYCGVLLVGILSCFRPTVLSAGARMQADAGDTILNHYILEHSWLWLTQPDYPASLWSPEFFYPAPHTLAYSENLLGTAPLYWLCRLVWTPITAYILWMIGVCAITYLAFVWVLRRCGVRPLLAAFGGLIFAFGLPRAAQIGHQQLLPHMFAPLAVYAAWRMVVRPRLGTFAGLLAACFLQSLACIYLGWFLYLGLGVFVILLVAANRARWASFREFARRCWLPALGILGVWAALSGLLFRVYLKANRGFERNWHACVPNLPWLHDWLLPSTFSLPAAVLGIHSGTDNIEHCCCPGWVVVGLVILGCILAAFPRGSLTRRKAILLRALAGTTIILVLLGLADIHEGSLWWLIHRCVPGATAIRAVGRIALTALLFALLTGLVALETYLARWGRNLRVQVGLALILFLGAVEHYPVDLPSFETASFYAHIEPLARELNRGDIAYVIPRPSMPDYTNSLLAMWAGLQVNRPVINGYSGREPMDFPDSPLPPDAVVHWLASHPPPMQHGSGHIVYIVPRSEAPDAYESVLVDLESAGVE